MDDDNRAAAGCAFAAILVAMIIYAVGVAIGKGF